MSPEPKATKWQVVIGCNIPLNIYMRQQTAETQAPLHYGTPSTRLTPSANERNPQSGEATCWTG